MLDYFYVAAHKKIQKNGSFFQITFVFPPYCFGNQRPYFYKLFF